MQNRMGRRKGVNLYNAALRILLMGFVVAGLVGCVTVEDKPFKKKANKQRLIEVSVSAANSYIKARQLDKAKRHLNKALEADRKSPKVHNTYALLYRVEGEDALAEKHYRLAIKYDPGYSQAHNNYGTLLYQQGRYKESLEELKIAASDPQYDRRAQVFENIGRCSLKLADTEQARKAFQKAVRLDAKLARSLIELAKLSYSEEKYVNAYNYLNHFDAVAKHSPESLWLGIRIQRVLGNKDALASYELALKNMYPNSMEYQEYLKSIVQ